VKNKIFSIVLVLLLCAATVLPVLAGEASPRLYDGAELLSEDARDRIQKRLDEVSDKYKVELVIVTVDGMDGLSPEDFASSYYNSGNYGFGDGRDGVLLLVSMEDRDSYILANGKDLGAKAVSPDDIDNIGDSVAEHLSDEEYEEAFETFISKCEYEIDGEINGFPFDYGPKIIIALIIGFVIAFIVTGVWKGQLNSVRQKVNAEGYAKKGSMKITTSRDFFLYKTVSRVKIQKSSGSSSGGGSSRHGGGRKF